MNTKKKTLSVLTMAATALLFAACDNRIKRNVFHRKKQLLILL